MLYLLKVQLGGICCFSMKFIVILDLIGTLILPSTLLYVGIMLYNATIGDSQLSKITVLVFAFSVAVQLLVPLLRLQVSYLWSAFIYCECYPFSFWQNCFSNSMWLTLLCQTYFFRCDWCPNILSGAANLLFLASWWLFLGSYLPSSISTCYHQQVAGSN